MVGGLLSWEAIAAFSSAVIAFCALVLTIWQATIARSHNKLSVTPHLSTWSHSDYLNNQYAVELLNNGIGPALIERFELQVDGCPIVGKGAGIVETALKILFPQYRYTSHQSHVSKGYMMGAKETRNLIAIKFEGKELPSSEEVERAFKRARLLIEYKSIYQETFIFDSSKFQD